MVKTFSFDDVAGLDVTFISYGETPEVYFQGGTLSKAVAVSLLLDTPEDFLQRELHEQDEAHTLIPHSFPNDPTPFPTPDVPTHKTSVPTRSPSLSPTGGPSKSPTTRSPTNHPTIKPTKTPTSAPSTRTPTASPTDACFMRHFAFGARGYLVQDDFQHSILYGAGGAHLAPGLWDIEVLTPLTISFATGVSPLDEAYVTVIADDYDYSYGFDYVLDSAGSAVGFNLLNEGLDRFTLATYYSGIVRYAAVGHNLLYFKNCGSLRVYFDVYSGVVYAGSNVSGLSLRGTLLDDIDLRFQRKNYSTPSFSHSHDPKDKGPYTKKEYIDAIKPYVRELDESDQLSEFEVVLQAGKDVPVESVPYVFEIGIESDEETDVPLFLSDFKGANFKTEFLPAFATVSQRARMRKRFPIATHCCAVHAEIVRVYVNCTVRSKICNNAGCCMFVAEDEKIKFQSMFTTVEPQAFKQPVPGADDDECDSGLACPPEIDEEKLNTSFFSKLPKVAGDAAGWVIGVLKSFWGVVKGFAKRVATVVAVAKLAQRVEKYGADFAHLIRSNFENIAIALTVALLTTLFYKFWDEISTFLDLVLTSLSGLGCATLDFIVGWFRPCYQYFKKNPPALINQGNTATQSCPTQITPQSGAAVLATAAAMVGFVSEGKYDPVKHTLEVVHKIGKAVVPLCALFTIAGAGASTILERLPSVIQIFMYQKFGLTMSRVSPHMEALIVRADAIIRTYDSHVDGWDYCSGVRTKADSNPELNRALAADCIALHCEMTKQMTREYLLAKNPSAHQFVTNLMKNLGACLQKARSVMGLGTNRPEPASIYIYGGSQIGKTTIATALAVALHPEVDTAELMFNRNVTDKYVSGYHQQRFFYCDDFGTSSTPEAVIVNADMLRLISGAAASMNMAAVGDKGQAFTSGYVGVSSNTPPSMSMNGITNPEAFLKRFIYLRMVIKDEFKTEGGDLNTSKIKPGDYSYCHLYIERWKVVNGSLERIYMREVQFEEVVILLKGCHVANVARYYKKLAGEEILRLKWTEMKYTEQEAMDKYAAFMNTDNRADQPKNEENAFRTLSWRKENLDPAILAYDQPPTTRSMLPASSGASISSTSPSVSTCVAQQSSTTKVLAHPGYLAPQKRGKIWDDQKRAFVVPQGACLLCGHATCVCKVPSAPEPAAAPSFGSMAQSELSDSYS